MFHRLEKRYAYKLFLVILSVFVTSLCFSCGPSRRKNYCLWRGERIEKEEDRGITKRTQLLAGYLLSVPWRNWGNLIGPRRGINRDLAEPNEINWKRPSGYISTLHYVVFLFLAAHFDVSLLLLLSFTSVHYVSLFFPFLSLVAGYGFGQNTVMRRITTFRSTSDRIYDGFPIRYYIILPLCYNCLQYSAQ
jgi:hypothetical protein